MPITIDSLMKSDPGTQAYIRFSISFYRTSILLNASLTGLQKSIQNIDGVLKKLKNGVVHESESKSGLNMIYDLMEVSQKEHRLLDTYIYSVLIVFVWGTFETYLNQAFEESFRKQPNMLKTKTTKNPNVFTSLEILDNIDDPLSLLINMEMNKLGHFKIKDWSDYLKLMINFEFDTFLYNELKGIYLVRNIIAHNTGLVREDQRQDIPSTLEIVNNELLLSKEYLDNSMDHIKEAVFQIEEQFKKKFYQK